MATASEADDNSGIRTVTLIEALRLRPMMYWGTPTPGCDDVVELLKGQLSALQCTDIRVLQNNGWSYVVSLTDWITPAAELAGGLKELFSKTIVFPQDGHNVPRVEAWVAAFAESLLVWRDNRQTVLQGEAPPGQIEFLQRNLAGFIAVGFSGNTYAKQRG